MIYEIQPSAYTDQLTDDGVQLTKLPYPIFADEAGMIGRQDFWAGRYTKVIGFQRDLRVQRIDLFWRDTLRDPGEAVGMYLVAANDKDNWFTFDTAVQSVTVLGQGPKNFSDPEVTS